MLGHWKELIPGEVWTHPEFISESNVDRLLNMMSMTAPKELDGRDKQLVSTGYYNYLLHDFGLRGGVEFEPFRTHLMSQLNRLFRAVDGREARIQEFNPIQLFSKSFSLISRYDPHTEPKDIFGEFVFILYLKDEESGALRFLKEEESLRILDSIPGARQAWVENENYIHSRGEQIRYIGPLSVLPRRNHCVVFRTGSVHVVEALKPQTILPNELARPCISGWPFAVDFDKYWKQSQGKLGH